MMNPCDQCQVVKINGTACHETGCPNSWLNPVTGEPNPIECKECGCDFNPEDRYQVFCDINCADPEGPLDDPTAWSGGFAENH